MRYAQAIGVSRFLTGVKVAKTLGESRYLVIPAVIGTLLFANVFDACGLVGAVVLILALG